MRGRSGSIASLTVDQSANHRDCVGAHPRIMPIARRLAHAARWVALGNCICACAETTNLLIGSGPPARQGSAVAQGGVALHQDSHSVPSRQLRGWRWATSGHPLSRLNGIPESGHTGGSDDFRFHPFAVPRPRQVVPRRHGHSPSTTQEDQVKQPAEQHQRPKQDPARLWRGFGGGEPRHSPGAVRAYDVTLTAGCVDRCRQTLAHDAIVAGLHGQPG
jgi:hypothetical protein